MKGVAIMLCSLATKIGKEELEEITNLERELGKTILAFKCQSEAKPAELSKPELKRIKEIEDKLGLALVAVEY